MRKLFFFFAFLFICSTLKAQTNSGVIYSSVNPTNAACSSVGPLVVFYPSGALFSCQSGLLAAIGGGSSGTCTTLAGDVTGTCAANTVVKVNGASVPTSAIFVGSNSSQQFTGLSATQATAALNICQGGLKGEVPANPVDATKYLDGTCSWTVPSGSSTNANYRNIGFSFSNSGSALSGTTVACDVNDVAGTINKWYVVGDVSGSATIGVKKVAIGSYTGTSGYSGYTDVVSTGTPPSLTSATQNSGTTFTNWVTTVTADDIYCVQVSSPSSVTVLNILLRVSAN